MRLSAAALLIVFAVAGCTPPDPAPRREGASDARVPSRKAASPIDGAELPMRFVERLYDLAGPPVPDDRLFAPDLARLVARAQQVAMRTEDPDLVGDPLCDCQDITEFHVATALVSETADTAEVRAVLTGGADGPRRFLLRLARRPDGWRLTDSIFEPGGSYAEALRRELAGR